MSRAGVVVAAVLERGYAVRIRVDGDSMDPLLRSGDALIVEPAVAETLRVGDVVLARLDRGLTAHRVIRLDREAGRVVGIRSRGDNCAEADPPFSPERILGRVISRERDGRLVAVRRARWTLAARRHLGRATARVGRLARRFSRVISRI